MYNPFGYRGEYTDSESGLVYLRARMYDPETGRFINEDPAKDGLNWYVYCNGNPITFIDPFGLFDYNTKLSKSNQYSDDVKVLQNELAWLGYYSGKFDGYLGIAAGFSKSILLKGGDAAANGVSLSPKGIYKGLQGIAKIVDSQEDKNNIIKGINWYNR